MHPNSPHPSDTRNLLIALALGMLVMGGWQYFYVAPQQAKQQAYLKQKRAEQAKQEIAETSVESPKSTEAPVAKSISRAELLGTQTATRLPIHTNTLHGSLSLIGGRLDDLTLAKYRETLEKDSPEVVLFTPAKAKDAYFAEFGWLAGEGAGEVPDANTRWSTDAKEIVPNVPVTLRWTNAKGVEFTKEVTLDKQYMFRFKLSVKNTSSTPLTLYPYGRIQREIDDNHKHFAILHEGPIGVVNNTLQELKYKDLREEGPQSAEHKGGWIGFTDKYWLAVMIPAADTLLKSTTQFLRSVDDSETRGIFQTDIRAEAITVKAGETVTHTERLFAGAKVVSVLDAYRAEYNIPLFDRAVDFGALYFLTKPIFRVLDFLYGFVGNFGVAILILTVFIKALMYPLANKSYTAMSQMKVLMPKIQELQQRYADDRMKMNTELMALYKNEKVNPMSGCLPILIQIPVFFALYKVLFVTLEMRHAPFFGWIHDLSAPDPTNIFTLFGLIPWDAPAFLHLGIWPIIMCATMVIQQRLNPKPTDELQAKIIGWMPYMFLFMFASFPAGLVIYWAWNNLLSIIQQRIILQRVERKKAATGHVY